MADKSRIILFVDDSTGCMYLGTKEGIEQGLRVTEYTVSVDTTPKYHSFSGAPIYVCTTPPEVTMTLQGVVKIYHVENIEDLEKEPEFL